MILRSLLSAIQDGGDADLANRQLGSQTNDQEKDTGESLLKVIRLLAAMDPEESTALIKLLKALG